MEKKLYKSSNDKVLAGVCGGIAEYFAVDAVIVRMMWIVFTLMGGAGLLAYIIAMIIIPENPYGKSVGDNYTRYEDYNTEQGNSGNNRSSSLVLGGILILFGAFVLLRNFFPFIPKDLFLAAILIGLGCYFLIRKK